MVITFLSSILTTSGERIRHAEATGARKLLSLGGTILIEQGLLRIQHRLIIGLMGIDSSGGAMARIIDFAEKIAPFGGIPTRV